MTISWSERVIPSPDIGDFTGFIQVGFLETRYKVQVFTSFLLLHVVKQMSELPFVAEASHVVGDGQDRGSCLRSRVLLHIVALD